MWPPSPLAPGLLECASSFHPLTCIMYDTQCLVAAQEYSGINGTGAHGFDTYIEFVLGGLEFHAMSGSFLGSLLLFTLARFGGLPIPDTSLGKCFWAVFMRGPYSGRVSTSRIL